MGTTKSDLFSTAQNDLADIAKALAHPARIAILDYLLQANACINGDFVNELGLAQATVSQHLKALKSVGLIQGTISGPRTSYCINSERWLEISALFEGLFAKHQTKKSICC
jgi:predicted transcriptional regulator